MKRPASYDIDDGRRVLQCGCGRACLWAGRDVALAAGWGARWANERRVWSCPDCYIPPAAPPAAAPNLTTPPAVIAAASGSQDERRRLRADLTRLIEVDPVRGRAWVADIARTMTGNSGRAKEWRSWAAQHGAPIGPKPVRRCGESAAPLRRASGS